MCEYKFKVAYPFHDHFFIWIPCLMFASFILYASFAVGYPVQGIGMTIYLLLLCSFGSLVGAMFRIQVDGETIRVRSWCGKRYELNCEDISKVVCTRRNSVKYGPQFYLTIATQQREFTMHGSMVGFETMAGYILAQLEAGKIKQTAVSKSCAEQLQKYQKGIFKRKKKKEG